VKYLLWSALILSVAASSQAASEHRGQVRTGEVPIPGAVVRATQGVKVVHAITDAEGNYSIADMSDGTWTVQIEMLGFKPIQQEVVVSTAVSGVASPVWDLKLLPVGEIHADAAPGFRERKRNTRRESAPTRCRAGPVP